MTTYGGHTAEQLRALDDRVSRRSWNGLDVSVVAILVSLPDLLGAAERAERLEAVLAELPAIVAPQLNDLIAYEARIAAIRAAVPARSEGGEG